MKHPILFCFSIANVLLLCFLSYWMASMEKDFFLAFTFAWTALQTTLLMLFCEVLI